MAAESSTTTTSISSLDEFLAIPYKEWDQNREAAQAAFYSALNSAHTPNDDLSDEAYEKLVLEDTLIPRGLKIPLPYWLAL